MFGRFATVILGVWLVIAPYVLGYSSHAARTNDLWTGLAVIAVSLIAMWVGGSERFVLTGLGAYLVASPWILSYTSGRAKANDVLVGLGVIAFSLVHSVPRRSEWEIGREGEVLP